MVPALIALLSAGSAALWAKDPPNRAHLNGSYQMVVAGDFVGEGNTVVTPKSVHINVQLTGQDDQKLHLNIPNMPLSEGNFQGEKSIDGTLVKVTGRIEAADGTIVLQHRVTCIISTADGRFARGVAYRKGDAGGDEDGGGPPGGGPPGGGPPGGGPPGGSPPGGGAGNGDKGGKDD